MYICTVKSLLYLVNVNSYSKKSHFQRGKPPRSEERGGGYAWLRPGHGRTLQTFGKEGLARQGMRCSDKQSVVAVFGEARGRCMAVDYSNSRAAMAATTSARQCTKGCWAGLAVKPGRGKSENNFYF
jgi:hypothetical protein